MTTDSTLQQSLLKLGLTAKEITLYLSLLETQKNALSPLAKHAGLPLTTAQYLMEKLAHEGLIRIDHEQSRKRYYATPPEQVLLLLKKRRATLDAQITSLNDVLPDLMQQYNTSPYQPRVRLFQNKNIKELYQDIIDNAPGEYLYTCNNEIIFAAVGKRFLDGWIKERARRKIKARGIWADQPSTDEAIYSTAPKMLREIRLGPIGFASPALVVIYGDHVGIITSAEEQFGVIITSKDYATTMRHWFSTLWDNSRPYTI